MAQQQRPVTELLREAAGGLRAVDTADTHAVLEAACRGWISAGLAGRLLANRADRGEYLPLWENALPILEAAAALCAASSMSEDLRPEVDPATGTEGPINEEQAAGIRQQILDLVLALNSALAEGAAHAGDEAGRQACQIGTVLSSELGDCYEGRLRSFTNPWRMQFGPGSLRIQGRRRRKSRKK